MFNKKYKYITTENNNLFYLFQLYMSPVNSYFISNIGTNSLVRCSCDEMHENT